MSGKTYKGIYSSEFNFVTHIRVLFSIFFVYILQQGIKYIHSL